MIKNLMHGLPVELIYYQVSSQTQFQHSYGHAENLYCIVVQVMLSVLILVSEFL